MSIVRVNTLQELVETSDQLLSQLQAHEALEASAGAAPAPVYLVVPSFEWGETRKLQLRHTHPVGVEVITYPQLIEQLWELFGDGSPFVTELERRVLLRPLVSQTGLLPSSPSARFVTQFAEFVQEAVYPGLQPVEPLKKSESKVMELVSMYAQKLQNAGIVEPAQAEYALIVNGSCAGMRFVFEAPDLHSARVRRFIAGLEGQAAVRVVEQELLIDEDATLTGDELQDLRALLYTGNGGLASQGHVRVGEARGAHVTSDTIVELVRSIHESAGIAYEDIAVCLASPADAYPRLLQDLACARIPFQAAFSVQAAHTGLGAALFQLEQIDSNSDEEESFRALVDFISGPYSGISGEDARALQMRWREQAHSSIEARLLDIHSGFDQGNAQAAITKTRLEPLARMLDAPREERVRLLFDNAHDARLDVNALIDDRQAACVALEYLDDCARFSCIPDARELANLPVRLIRSFESDEGPLAIVSPHAVGLEKFQAIVLCDLDAAHYPMAAPSEPFDELMLNLGINRSDSLAKDQRIMLRNIIEASQRCFAFERTTHNPKGEESCQSALFDELLTVYRSEQENEDGLPALAIPVALQPWLCSMNEADALFGSASSDSVQMDVTRGRLERLDSVSELMLNAKGNPRMFSPTALEDYYRCPYRWFTCRRVGYNGMDAAFDAAARGSLVHAVMERFYRDLAQAGYRRVTPENLPQALDIASSAFDAQVEYSMSRPRKALYLKTQMDRFACEDLRSGVLELVTRDATFLPGFIPTYFELEVGSTAGRTSEYAGVPVRGKVDRIDVDADGSAVIVDYKLGGLSAGYGFGADEVLPQRIQTDIYATMVQRHFDEEGVPIKVRGSIYRSYSKNMLRGVYDRDIDWGPDEKLGSRNDALPREGVPETYGSYLQHVERAVAARVDRLKEGDIAPSPLTADTCDYCKARLFCPKGGA